MIEPPERSTQARLRGVARRVGSALPKLGSTLPKLRSALPIVVSCLALAVSYLGYRLNAIRNVKPALIISFSSDSGWKLRNVGNGPALNILVAQRREAGAWFGPVRVPALAAGDQVALFWLRFTNVRWLGATYTDIDGRQYSSRTSDDLTVIADGDIFPDWTDRQICRHWQLDTAATGDNLSCPK
jgi:hypothetical protein